MPLPCRPVPERRVGLSLQHRDDPGKSTWTGHRAQADRGRGLARHHDLQRAVNEVDLQVAALTAPQQPPTPTADHPAGAVVRMDHQIAHIKAR